MNFNTFFAIFNIAYFIFLCSWVRSLNRQGENLKKWSDTNMKCVEYFEKWSECNKKHTEELVSLIRRIE